MHKKAVLEQAIYSAVVWLTNSAIPYPIPDS